MRYSGALFYSLPMQQGVLTGSVLGPHLFNIYISNLMDSLQPDSSIVYADDVNLIIHGVSAAEATKNMQWLLHSIDACTNSNLMAMNSSKCFTIIISPFICKQTVVAYRVLLGNNLLSIVDSRCLLGIEFCKDLSKVTHSDKVRSKMSLMIGVLK